jgi:hypothetical protein
VGKGLPTRQSDILHKDLKPMPYWWEAYKPAAGELVDVPRKALRQPSNNCHSQPLPTAESAGPSSATPE